MCMTDAVIPSTVQRDRDQMHWLQKHGDVLVLYVVLTLIVIVYSLPSIGVILTSLKTTGEIARDGLWVLPREFRLTNYVEAWNGGNVGLYLRNSVLVTIPAT